MHETDLSFVPLLIVIALSFFVPVALSPIRRFGIPVIVGEILAGIAVGHSGLGLVTRDPVLDVLSAFGFTYLMFLSGLEMDFSQIPQRRGLSKTPPVRRLLRNPFSIGGLMFVATGACSLAAGYLLQWLGFTEAPLLMALILSTTSLGVVAPVLKERGLLANRYGQTILVCALIADFVTILAISVYVLVLGEGATLEIMLVLFLALVFIAAYRVAMRLGEHVPAQRLMRALSTATSQIQVRGSFAVALVFIALAEGLGIENILGAFLAGVIISMLSGSHGSILREKLDAIGYGFLIPVFFVMVGVNFNLPALLASGSATELVLLLTAIAFAVKLVGGLVFRISFGWRETLGASTLLSARLSLLIAVVTIGKQINVITPALEAAVILVAIVTCLASPVLFARLMPAAGGARGRVLVVGSDQDAETLATRLRKLGQDAKRVGDNAASQDQSSGAEEGEDAQPAAPSLAEQLRAAGIEQASALVALDPDDAVNLQACRIAREIHSVVNVVAWVRDPGFNTRFIDAGVRVINPGNSKLLILENLAISGHALGSTQETVDGQDIRVIKLRNWWLRGRALRQIALPDSVSVLRIERGGDVIVPGPDTVARANDVFTLTGNADDVDLAARRLARPS